MCLGSLDKWREAKVRGVWFKVALADSAWVPHLAQVIEKILSLSFFFSSVSKSKMISFLLTIRMDSVITMLKHHMS